MIIEPRIHVTDEELALLKSGKRGTVQFAELAIEIARRVRRSIQTNSFSVIEYVRDHATNEEGEIVDSGEIEVRLDN